MIEQIQSHAMEIKVFSSTPFDNETSENSNFDVMLKEHQQVVSELKNLKAKMVTQEAAASSAATAASSAAEAAAKAASSAASSVAPAKNDDKIVEDLSKQLLVQKGEKEAMEVKLKELEEALQQHPKSKVCIIL